MTENNLLTHVEHIITEHNLIPHGSTVVLGLSGGPDSIFLLHVLADLQKQQKLTVIAVHLDHQWRPTSHEDARFCQAEAQKLGVECIVKRLTDYLPKQLKPTEAAGREARYKAFEEVRAAHNAATIALAHHLQDLQETFFIRLIRGAKLSGLAGMSMRHKHFIRPLLGMKKKDIVTFLNTNHIAYVHDESNNSLDFLRNRVRHTVLPALQQCDDRFDNNFARVLNDVQETEQFIHAATREAYKASSQSKTLDIKLFLQLHLFLQPSVIVAWLRDNKVTFPLHEAFVQEILRFLKQPQGGEHQIHAQWKIIKKQHQAWIENYF